MNDFTYLENVGRKVGDWGAEIVKGGHMGRGQGKGKLGARNDSGPVSYQVYGQNAGPNGLPLRNAAGQAPPRSKMELLQRQLAARDVQIMFLPDGMEKRRLNQSTWDNQ